MEEYNDQIEGRNAVLEYLESGKDINKILVATGEKHGSINKIIAIPYYAWANRGKSEMQVWLPVRINEVKVNY